MERKERKLYRAGDFAAIFGVKKDTLFYYDRIGIFRPVFRAANGYRYYGSSQFSTFSIILTLRNMDIPIERIREYLSAKNPESLMELFDLERKRIDKRIRKLKELSSMIESNISIMKEAMEMAGKPVSVRYFPEEYIIESLPQKGKKIDWSDEWWALYSSIYGKDEGNIGITGSKIALDDILRGEFSRLESIFVMTGRKTETEIPAGMYAVKYAEGPYSGYSGIYRSFLDEIDRMGYIPSSAAYEEYAVDEMATDRSERFISRIRIMVKEKRPAEPAPSECD